MYIYIYMVYIKKYSNRNLSNKVHISFVFLFVLFCGWVPSTLIHNPFLQLSDSRNSWVAASWHNFLIFLFIVFMIFIFVRQ